MRFRTTLILLLPGLSAASLCFGTLPEGDLPPDEIADPGNGEMEATAQTYAMFMHALMLEDEDAEKAEKIYLGVLVQDPDAAYVYYKLANLYWRMGDDEKSLKNFELALEKDPGLKEAYVDYAHRRRQGGDDAGAVEVYERAVKNVEDNLDLYRNLAESHFLGGETEKALATWRDAAEEHPKEPEPWANIVRICLVLGKTEEAEKAVEQAIIKTEGSNRLLEAVRNVYIRARDEDRADQITLRLLEKRPNSARLWLNHILYHLRKGNMEEAKQAYAEGAENLAHRADFFADAGKLFDAHGEPEMAALAFEEGLRNRPEDVNLLLALATHYEKQERPQDACEIYEQLLKLRPASPAYRLKIGECQEDEGLLERALETYLGAKEKFPQSKEVRGRLIRTLLKLQRFDDAEIEFRELSSLYPGETELQMGYMSLLNINGKFDKAIEVGEAVLEKNPDPELLKALAGSHLGLKNYGRSAELLEQALDRMESVSPRDYIRLAAVYRKADNGDKADEYFEKAIGIYEKLLASDSSNIDVLLDLAGICEIRKHHDKAREYYTLAAEAVEAALADHADDAESHVRYADILQKVDRFEEAEEHYLIAIDRDPKSSVAMNNLGYMWIERDKNLSRAIGLIEKALEIEPDNPAYLDSLGWGFFKRGKYKDALEQLLKAVERGAEDAEIYEHLGDTYQRLKQYKEAISNWEKALQLESENPEAIEKKIEDARKKLE
jgi:tetratricopeptide (TPR) repeat protein